MPHRTPSRHTVPDLPALPACQLTFKFASKGLRALGQAYLQYCCIKRSSRDPGAFVDCDGFFATAAAVLGRSAAEGFTGESASPLVEYFFIMESIHSSEPFSGPPEPDTQD